MRVLITGVSGFIGKRLAQRFLKMGYDVVGTGRSGAPKDLTNIGYEQADLGRPEQCLHLLGRGFDTVIHCAGKAGAWGDFAGFERANVLATKNLLEASKSSGVKKFINISSPSIYFDYRDQLNLKENFLPPRFSNAYAETKYLAEECVRKAHNPGMHTVSLRPRGVIGAGDQNWLPRIIQMREANKLIQPGTGKNLADFTAVENLLDVIEACMDAGPEALGRTYNVTNGSPEPLWDVIDYALSAVGLDGKRKRKPLALAIIAARASEAYHRWMQTKDEPSLLPIKVAVAGYSMTLDISDAKKCLGYEPRLSTKDAVLEFASWWNAMR